jgi:hypothetical protein
VSNDGSTPRTETAARGIAVVVGWHAAVVVAVAAWILSRSGAKPETNSGCGGFDLWCQTSPREIALTVAIFVVPPTLAVSFPISVVVTLAVGKRARSGLAAGAAGVLAGACVVLVAAGLLLLSR